MSVAEVAPLDQFRPLFDEFVQAFAETEEGQQHLHAYEEQRIVARSNWQEIDRGAGAGTLDVDRVLLQLLPWTDSASNRAKGAWIHIAPAITGDLKTWFERLRWAEADNWPNTAEAIVAFVETCVETPAELDAACQAFTASPFTKGMQAGFLSPILNALRPEAYLLVNSKSQSTINHFAQTAFSTHLTDYPALNRTGLELLARLQPVIGPSVPDVALSSDLFDQFCHWLVAIRQFEFGRAGYWKIAPGENGRFWDEWRNEECVSIGWGELGDLSDVGYDEFARRRDELLLLHSDWTKEAVEQVWTFAHIREGDRVVANRGTKQVLGIGTVSGPYYHIPDAEYAHRMRVTWDDLRPRDVNKGGWRRTLIKLTRGDFKEIASSDVVVASGAVISSETFDLLSRLTTEPTAAFYQAHRQEFDQHVEAPMRALMGHLATLLPVDLRELLETQRGVYSRILKNDYGQGGAWDFYWAAFYPKGLKRTGAPQLFASLGGNALRYGFHVGEYGPEFRTRFRRRAIENREFLAKILGPQLEEIGVTLTDSSPTGEDAERTFGEWFQDPPIDCGIAVRLSRDQVEALAYDDLVARIARAFAVVGPLLRLAFDETPVTEIFDPAPEPPERNPLYTLEDIIRDTGMDRETLESWMRAIGRKGQAVLYGPPGTGKTFVAEKLARHLVSEADGFWELVQFHPAYSYEDFMEGIRPTTIDGHLSYEIRPGRFLQFCERARRVEGKCVLIVDEINRANLSRVFGELMYLLEYRTQIIPLASGSRFSIPENVVVLGTMNTADRSIALVDHALRRRFGFLRLRPNFDILTKYHADTGFNVEPLIELIQRVNATIADQNYELGITYFLDQNIRLNLIDIWETEIVPFIEEYFFDDPRKVDQFRWGRVREALGL